MIEIERKFLVISNAFLDAFSSKNEIAQGYLSSVPERTVRVRIKDDKAFLTIKGESSENGLSRLEIEKEITIDEANALLKICEKGVIKKTRYNIITSTQTIEVDVFHGENDGLIIAEIELKSEEEFYEKPSWLGKEVTNNIRYYNSFLSKNPFCSW
jgi:adenylate cyclase